LDENIHDDLNLKQGAGEGREEENVGRLGDDGVAYSTMLACCIAAEHHLVSDKEPSYSRMATTLQRRESGYIVRCQDVTDIMCLVRIWAGCWVKCSLYNQHYYNNNQVNLKQRGDNT
jgi:hypothetical protein